MTSIEHNRGSSDGSEPVQLDPQSRDRLRDFLARQLEVAPGAISIRRLADGHSNLTFVVDCDSGRYVMRAPPAGPLPPSAHDVLREHAVLSLLAGGGVRAPRPVLSCADTDVIGTAFYLMEHIDGVVIRDALPPQLDVEGAAPAIGDEFVDALAELHAVDWRAVGFDVIAQPDGYLERQLGRWRRQWAHNRTRQLPVVEALGSWLDVHRPSSPEVTIVHGDYKLDNVIFDVVGGRPHAAAILDWEMATLGDPLADVGYMLALWSNPGEDPALRLGLSAATTAPDFPTRDQLAERYVERSGRDVSVADLGWYQVLALWKLGILLEGSLKRHLAGTADDAWYAELGDGVPLLFDQAESLSCDIAP